MKQLPSWVAEKLSCCTANWHWVVIAALSTSSAQLESEIDAGIAGDGDPHTAQVRVIPAEHGSYKKYRLSVYSLQLSIVSSFFQYWVGVVGKFWSPKRDQAALGMPGLL